MAQPNLSVELEDFKNFLKSESSEDARRPLLYPLFKKLYKDKFKIESDACGADVYIEGTLLVESKTDSSQWLEGFYQALHYHKRFGLAYNTIMVVAHRFVGIWKVNKLPEEAVIFSHTVDAYKAPNVVGKENARQTQKPLRNAIAASAFYFLTPKDLEGDIFAGAKNLTTESYEILKILRNLDSDRLQINTHNFIHAIERMMPMFAHPIDAVHAFYTIVPFWDITATVAVNENSGEVRVIGFKGQKLSDNVEVMPRAITYFKKMVETNYVFTNEGSGLTVDYYFSRFDEVLAKVDPEYVKQHGIFFTNDNLSKFAMWYVKKQFGSALEEDYIVFDPAGGSGNLVSSWRGRLKHKIISELQPDLLRIIERRMKADPYHIEVGFTIVPKTSDNAGLNFLDRSAADYLHTLELELARKQVKLDKPLAFLLNPPYKNTDENVKEREERNADYSLHPDILALTGKDAGKERYLAFLGQIMLMSKQQYNENGVKPLVMIFTPTSWLIPRPTYIPFRKKWDKHFSFHSGFLVTSNEWFKLKGSWPIAFTIWRFEPDDQRSENSVLLNDLTSLTKTALNIDWNQEFGELQFVLDRIINSGKEIKLDNSRGDIKCGIPLLQKGKELKQQQRLNLYRNKTKQEAGLEFISGFALRDERHKKLSVPYGFANGEFVGFMDNGTPLRVRQDLFNRLSNSPDRVWFYLDSRIIKVNLLKIFNGPPDKYAYCAYDLTSAKFFCSWFAIGKAIAGNYPAWANQYDIWRPNILENKEASFYALCFAFVLAENRCVVIKFEEDNPITGAPEIFVDNPLSPNNPHSFWCTTMANAVANSDSALAKELVTAVVDLYKYWNLHYSKGQFLYHVGLQDEAYFKYFSCPDFLTKDSGLIQIKRYAEIHSEEELLIRIDRINAVTKAVKKEIYDMLIRDFEYFD